MFHKSVRRFEYQLYLAKENPEPIYDVSNCGLLEVPSGCFSLCKVLRKKKLFLNNNQIKDVQSNGNKVEDLTVLTHMYLEFNEIPKLPENIYSIQYLQILNVSNNKLTSLPNSIGGLLYLRELYVQNNSIEELPVGTWKLKNSLEVIDLSENIPFSLIPIEIFSLFKLRKFNCTLKYLKYPLQNVCKQGIFEVLHFLCEEKGINIDKSFIQRLSGTEDNNSNVMDSSLLDYEQYKKDKLQYLESIEKEYNQVILCHKTLTEKATNYRLSFLKKLTEQEAKFTDEIIKIQRNRDAFKQQLINDVKSAENDAANLIEEIIAVSKAYQKQESVLDEIENEAIKKYQLYQISKDEMEHLRRREILSSMSHMLVSQEVKEKIFKNRKVLRKNIENSLFQPCFLSDKTLSDIIDEKQNRQNKFLNQLENEENMQKMAFQRLQMQKDIRTLRLINQIYSVQSELILLSQAEQKNISESLNLKPNILNEHREQLMEMLDELMQKKNERERVLSQRMRRIEEQRQNDQTDFWLVQYQRCLDMKSYNFFDQVLQRYELSLDTELLNGKTTETNASDIIKTFKETECAICFDREIPVLFLTCGHICCENCTNKIKECSFCGKNITRIIKLYW